MRAAVPQGEAAVSQGGPGRAAGPPRPLPGPAPAAPHVSRCGAGWRRACPAGSGGGGGGSCGRVRGERGEGGRGERRRRRRLGGGDEPPHTFGHCTGEGGRRLHVRSVARGSPETDLSIPQAQSKAATKHQPLPDMDEGISRLPERQLLEHRDFIG